MDFICQGKGGKRWSTAAVYARAWIIQALWKARHNFFLCGDFAIKGPDFKTLPGLFEDLAHLNPGFNERLKKVSRLLSSINSGDDYHRDHHLADLISTSDDTECTDGRDRIYALLGLVWQDPARNPLEADYTIKTTTLCFRVLARMSRNSESSEIGVKNLLSALKLKWSDLVAASSDIDLGFDRVTIESDDEDSRRLFSSELTAVNLQGWARSCKIQADSICQLTRRGRVCFVLRTGRKRSPEMENLDRFLHQETLSTEFVVATKEPYRDKGYGWC